MNRFIAGVLSAVLASSVQAAPGLQSELEDVLRRKPDLDAGERLYMVACGACHGIAGEGQPQGQVPRIAGQRYSVIAGQLVEFRLGRRMDGRMQGRAAGHFLPGGQDLADVAAYAAQLPGGTVAQGTGKLLESSAQLYANRCSSCHGARAEGSDQPAIPRLAAQHHGYLARQLHDLIDGRRPAAARDHLQQLKSIDEDQISGLADYLSRLP